MPLLHIEIALNIASFDAYLFYTTHIGMNYDYEVWNLAHFRLYCHIIFLCGIPILLPEGFFADFFLHFHRTIYISIEYFIACSFTFFFVWFFFAIVSRADALYKINNNYIAYHSMFAFCLIVFVISD